MADLKPRDLECAEFCIEVFGNSAKELDAMYLGKFMYNMNVNPSQERLIQLGMTKKEGEKTFKFDELLPMVSDLKKEIKDQGCYEDFVECLKLYDKNENGLMQSGELSHCLLTLGEKLTDDEVDVLLEECLDEEDDDGQVPYIPFLKRMCEMEPPLKPSKKKL
ncbi:unnamed protein product [Phaedon cochleariae]|uniref:Myosin light chain alkali n=1 Tax=Phaedon cochleariae TaxID=80249 RepID=A0A9P0GPI0_PHACE|nr:unnamed protein product [Phaedon cochleariae]